jgi:alginate O-acetyltransferase complex protein AlgI
VLTGFSGQPLYDFEVLSAISNNVIWLTLAIIASTPLPLRIYQKVCELKQLKINQWIIPATNLALLGISTTLLVGKTYNPFIYFRF